MVRRAAEQNAPQQAAGRGAHARVWESLHYIVLDARDETFRLDPPVDLVSAMYLLHYAPSEDDLERMARLIARNLKPGGRFVTYTLSPDYDFHRREPRLMERCGFDYAVVGGPHCMLIIGEERVNIWQWSREVHETRLRRAGLDDIRWHPLQAPPDARPEVMRAMAFYLANPSCIVLSATKPG
jgi:SAM-dependent methyltransferase